MKKTLTFLAIASLMLTACDQNKPTESVQAESSAAKNEPVSTKATDSPAPELTESDKANQLFDAIYKEGVNRSPITQTYLGIKTDYDKWDDISEENALKELQITKENLQRIQEIDTGKLDQQTLLSYQLFRKNLEEEIDDFKWRHHNYPVNQMYGMHSQIPAFLINQHAIKDVKEANDYVARLNGANKLIKQLIEQLKIREKKGIIAPKFVFEHVIRDSKNILVGAPFEPGEDSTLWADFKSKLNQLELDSKKKDELLSQAKNALLTSIQPGYNDLVNYLASLEDKADTRDGAWKFPDGEAFFNNALKRTTTTELTADQIHEMGLSEVKRIHNEMQAIMKQVKFDGSLAEFFKFMRHDPRFYYPDTEEGRKRYLNEAIVLIDDMKSRLDELFITKPKADLEVKRVEAFREKSAGKAFYQQPAPDGSRPGRYYANLYKMEGMPIYQMAALAYHEGIPGHHMQFAIMQELEDMPMFRKFGGYTAYSEGWGLYSEMIPKEIGLYADPYSDFGRLAMELWRACRLVVDTGIHTKKWTREQGIEYYVKNTPNAESEAVKMVERHIVMPSQATAYKVGMLKILSLREKAKKAMSEQFDIREFHDVVLKNGAVPLSVLESLVDEYIASKPTAGQSEVSKANQ
ncbi:DUF885 domain-containing protein [Aliikangiella coralliicola]|uniref:DUF885 domain-containing protein n=1 Tax=Aliikangiella coralliicola TaxID=2592383 RepID=A0A545U7V3_9GAMM|nr:DUF885 domain-containing protein [Aliikangiella coralliicola]TQV85546.1 DUF885 domain-containing protein [Aliikangiella coralliicola]